MTSSSYYAQQKTSEGIHQLGFGTWQAKQGEVARALDIAVRAGFRHIDCARIYLNEAEIGAAFRQLFAEAPGGLKRSDLFVTSKLWNTDHNPANVEAACRQTLADLQLEYLDLYLIHWPVAWAHPGEGGYTDPSKFFPRNTETGGSRLEDFSLLNTWAAMERLVDLGLVKHIGLSNASIAQVREVHAAARHKPFCNQVEVQPGCPQNQLCAVHKELGIVTVAYCPLAIGMGGATAASLINHPKLAELAASVGKTPAEVLLRWNLQRGNVVLTKSVTESRIREAAQLASSDVLPADVIAAVDALGKEEAVASRVCNPDFFCGSAGPFFAENGL